MSSDKLSFEDIQAAVAAAKSRQRPAGGHAGANVARAQPYLGPSRADGAESEPEPDIPPYPAGLEAGKAPEDGSGGGRRRWRIGRIVQAAVALCGLAGFAALVWWGYGVATRGDPDAEVPIITAELGPEKVRPESEGGLEVPNQDRLIYDEITPGEEQARVESLLPEPETPMTPPVPETGEATPSPPAEASSQTVESVPAPAAPDTPGETSTFVPPIPPEPPPAVAEAEPEPSQVAAAGSGFRIQLAAFKTPAAARESWGRLQRRHPDALQGLTLTVEQADLGAAGVFYRVQAGPLANRKAAEAICGQLKQRNQPCLVVAP